jgi:hypothetical protein
VIKRYFDSQTPNSQRLEMILASVITLAYCASMRTFNCHFIPAVTEQSQKTLFLCNLWVLFDKLVCFCLERYLYPSLNLCD